jgi:hypothetical protein
MELIFDYESPLIRKGYSNCVRTYAETILCKRSKDPSHLLCPFEIVGGQKCKRKKGIFAVIYMETMPSIPPTRDKR